MSERDDRYASPDLPSTTAEFRAAPDISASTAEFKRFAAAHDSDSGQPWTAKSWPDQPASGIPAQRASRRTAIIVGSVIAVAAVIIIAIVAGLGV